MHTHEADGEQGLGAATRRVAEHASALARLELELAALEVKQKLVALAAGIALAVTAVVLVLYALGFLLAGAASGLDAVLPMWAALLVVAGALLVAVAILAAVAAVLFRRGAPPVPEQAIQEAKITQEALKADGKQS